jgi:hypothetical protein
MNQLEKPQQHLPSSITQTSPSERLKPVTAAVGETELLACLVLVAPSGMTADDRHAWIRVARETLKGIPEDLLQRGCKKARETCRFASEIVPAIVDEVQATWDRRKRDLAFERQAFENRHAPRLTQQEPDLVSSELMAELVRSLQK